MGRKKGVYRTIEKVIQVICERSVETSNGCYEWQGSCNEHGYGKINIAGKYRKVHVVVYEYCNGFVPKGLELDHKCRNRKCWKGEHLEPTTHKENCLRGISFCAVNSRKTHCSRGHLYEGGNVFITKNGWRVCKICRRNWDNGRVR